MTTCRLQRRGGREGLGSRIPALQETAEVPRSNVVSGTVRACVVVTKPLELRTEQDQGAPRLVVSGELDLASAEQLDAQLKQLESPEPDVIVLDLRELEFMDSTGLRTVIAADSRARERGARLVVVRAPEEVDRVFRLTRMDQHLELVDRPPQ